MGRAGAGSCPDLGGKGRGGLRQSRGVAGQGAGLRGEAGGSMCLVWDALSLKCLWEDPAVIITVAKELEFLKRLSY